MYSPTSPIKDTVITIIRTGSLVDYKYAFVSHSDTQLWKLYKTLRKKGLKHAHAMDAIAMLSPISLWGTTKQEFNFLVDALKMLKRGQIYEQSSRLEYVHKPTQRTRSPCATAFLCTSGPT